MSKDSCKGQEQEIEQHRIAKEPFYVPVREEIILFRTAFESKIPVMLKGPTGCGKTRFLQHMAYLLKRPLITVACHEDLTASDLVGRYLLKGDDTVWMDGPLKDTTVVIHPLTDDRRILPIEKKGQIIEAQDEFMLVISYNPGYQSVLKDLKQSTKQRFMAIEFDYPPKDLEIHIVQHEAGVSEGIAQKLVKLGEKVRNLRQHGLEEGVSTRLLIYSGELMKKGIDAKTACDVAITRPITDDPEMQRSITEIVSAIF